MQLDQYRCLESLYNWFIAEEAGETIILQFEESENVVHTSFNHFHTFHYLTRVKYEDTFAKHGQFFHRACHARGGTLLHQPQTTDKAQGMVEGAD